MPRPRNLGEDQRGAILVVCVACCAFLVGCLWFMLGIGDAAVHRERLQDASDSAVFAAAVYHARGMNVIAMINLCMAAILSVLAALKVSEILNGMYLGITSANCACTPIGCPNDCPFVQPSAKLAQDLSERIDKMTDLEDKVNRALSKTQKSIAEMVPYQAQERGTRAAKDYFHVDVATAVSISMLPDGRRLGLPVEEDRYELLCEKAAQVIGMVAMNPLSAYGLEPAPSGAFYIVAGQVPATVQAVTSTLCEDGAGKTPKKVYTKAKNGDEYFQVYSYVLHTRDRLRKRSDSRVDVALITDAKGERAATAKGAAQSKSKPFAFQNAGMAEAEFYYDQTPGKPGGLEWEGYKDDTLWNMRWRARLRRYRNPPPQVQALSPGGVAQALSSYVKDVIH